MPKFGIEIECYNLETIPSAVSQLGWSEHGDGSINGRYSAEIVSPPLRSVKASFDQVKEMMSALRNAGAEINRSCGLHVHVEVERSIFTECNPDVFFDTLVSRYHALEPYIDTLVPPSRRGNRNDYCRSMEYIVRAVRSDLDLFREGRETTIDIAEGYDRYHKLNIAAFARHGTVEFRHFGATLNGTKAVAWIKFCLAFVEAARQHSLRSNPVRMTDSDWSNPYYLLASRSATRYLTMRHEAVANPPAPAVAAEG